MHNINWDDFRYVLAVCEAGSLNGAARALGVNHATVLRRVKAFEELLGKPIFIKTRTGYNFDANAGDILDTLKDMQSTAEKLQRELTSRTSGINGLVRLTSTDSMCQLILPEIIDHIQKKYSGIRIELTSANHHVNMFQPDADITIRPALKAPKGLEAKSGGKTGFKIYATPEFWQNCETKPYAEWPWFGVTKLLERTPASAWMMQNIPEQSVKMRADSFMVLAEFAKIGSGATFLPCKLGEQVSELTTHPKFDLLLEGEVWVASHEDLLKNPHIKVCMDMLADLLRERIAQ
jgi:DNA-binding transcriptional LysR family regulator